MNKYVEEYLDREKFLLQRIDHYRIESESQLKSCHLIIERLEKLMDDEREKLKNEICKFKREDKVVYNGRTCFVCEVIMSPEYNPLYHLTYFDVRKDRNDNKESSVIGYTIDHLFIKEELLKKED